MNAVTLFLTVLFLFLTSTLVISMTNQVDVLAAAYEAASAIGTVGLTAGLTPSLTRPTQFLLILLMFTGRVGVLSFSLAFLDKKENKIKIQYPEFRIMIG